MYKLIRCRLREAAAAKAFYTLGVDGQNITFLYIMREGETFKERIEPIERVKELQNLAEDFNSNNKVKLFY